MAEATLAPPTRKNLGYEGFLQVCSFLCTVYTVCACLLCIQSILSCKELILFNNYKNVFQQKQTREIYIKKP